MNSHYQFYWHSSSESNWKRLWSFFRDVVWSVGLQTSCVWAFRASGSFLPSTIWTAFERPHVVKVKFLLSMWLFKYVLRQTIYKCMHQLINTIAENFLLKTEVTKDNVLWYTLVSYHHKHVVNPINVREKEKYSISKEAVF